MPNLDLQKQQFKIDNDNVKNFFDGNNSISYEYLNKVKSELNDKQDKNAHEKEVLKWIDKTLKTNTDAIDRPKRIIMQTDGQGDKKGGNAYKDTHKKDNDNSDPTRVRIPKIKGNVKRQIMSNKVQYESINSEIDSIKYLIEYMNNK